MRKIEFGMPVLLENGSLQENISLCRRLGLQFVEVNMSFPAYQLEFLENPEEFHRENDVFFTIHLDENLNIVDFNPLVRQAYVETVLRTIDAAKTAGIPILNMHMNHGIRVTLPDRKVYLYEQYQEEYLENIRVFRELCQERIGNADITITVENTDGFLPFEREAVELLLRSPVFGLNWDIGHSAATGEADLPFLMEHEKSLAHFHIHDGGQTPPCNHLALGDGAIDLKARLDCAARNNCRCVLETKTAAALEKSVTWLKKRGYM